MVKVDAYVAAPLETAVAGRVADTLGVALDGKTVELRQHVDSELIGGLKIQIGDQLIDVEDRVSVVPEVETYGGRSLSATTCPGILVDSFALTL